MLISDLTATALSGITANKKRSFFTTLGIIIGVASVVLMVSIGSSFQNYILTQIDTIGSSTVDVFPVGFEKFGGNLDSLSFEDYDRVSKLPSVQRAVPIIIVSKQVEFGKEKVSPMVMGTYQGIFANYSLKLATGRLLDDSDEQGAKFSAVVAAQTVEDLFGDVDPLGKHISIGGFSFTVVGTLEKQGSALLSNLDTPVFIPYSTARSVSGQKYLSFMNLKAVGDPQITIADIKETIRQRHSIRNPADDPEKDDFVARSAEQITVIINSVTLGLTVFLSLVAAISLLVGGIGIMNIMLVSVTERTREIGLRKAVGARKIDILLQFLLEAVALTLSGGFIGIILGAGTGWLLSVAANAALGQFSFVLSAPAILMAVGMAMSTGLIFGIYPARRAANLSPMEALRYE